MKKLLLGLLAFLLSGCGGASLFGPTPTPTPEPCNVQATAYVATLEGYFDEEIL